MARAACQDIVIQLGQFFLEGNELHELSFLSVFHPFFLCFSELLFFINIQFFDNIMSPEGCNLNRVCDLDKSTHLVKGAVFLDYDDM